MSHVVAGMTLSLDGYVNDEHGNTEKLYADFEEMHQYSTLQESIRTTGAVVMGRSTFEMSPDPDGYAPSYEYQVPIFVVSSKEYKVLPKQNDSLRFCFVNLGPERALELAKEAAGKKNVTVVGGVKLISYLLNVGLIDTLEIDYVSVVLGGGLNFFKGLEVSNFKLELAVAKRLSDFRSHLEFIVKK
jgi:dihydrofolate reductase